MTEYAAASARAGDLRHRPWLAALLSFLIPGMGQAYAGRPLLGLVMALPVTLLFRVVVGVAPARSAGFGTNCSRATSSSACSSQRLVLLRGAGSRSRTRGSRPGTGIHGHDRRMAVMVVGRTPRPAVAMHAWLGLVVRPVRHDAHAGLRDGASEITARRRGRRGGGPERARQRAGVRVGRHRADQHPPARD